MTETPEQRRAHAKHAASFVKSQPLAERFWSKVNKDGPVPAHRPDLGPCWVWTDACKKRDGYGIFSAKINGKWGTHQAQRIAWLLAKGKIPEGHGVLHYCDNPPCVNPNHLWTGTQLDNMRDCAAKQRCSKRWHEIGNPKCKLKQEDIAKIKAMVQEGKTRKEITAVFGITRGQIWRICTNKTWTYALLRPEISNQRPL